MNAPFVFGTASLVGGAGLVSAGAYLLVPAIQSWRQAHRETSTVSSAIEDTPDVLASLLLAAGEVDVLDFDHCRREQRTRPHALHADGSRRCWNCGHETAGDQ